MTNYYFFGADKVQINAQFSVELETRKYTYGRKETTMYK